MNEQQIAYWNSPAVARWTHLQPVMDRAIAPFGEAAIARAAVQPGESVLDVGCGCGDTLVALAQAVGATGRAVGIDVSASMLQRARERCVALPQSTQIQLDAACMAELDSYDLVFSRFGVMFFDDPVIAFRRIRAALHRSGRLSFVCWRRFEDNPWAVVPLQIVRDVAPALELPATSGAPGPYAFADPKRVEEVLAGAGFHDIALERFDAPVLLSTGDLDEAVHFTMSAGTASRAIANVEGPTRERIRERLCERLDAQRGPRGITLDASSWLVTARP